MSVLQEKKEKVVRYGFLKRILNFLTFRKRERRRQKCKTKFRSRTSEHNDIRPKYLSGKYPALGMYPTENHF